MPTFRGAILVPRALPAKGPTLGTRMVDKVRKYEENYSVISPKEKYE